MAYRVKVADLAEITCDTTDEVLALLQVLQPLRVPLAQQNKKCIEDPPQAEELPNGL